MKVVKTEPKPHKIIVLPKIYKKGKSVDWLLARGKSSESA